MALEKVEFGPVVIESIEASKNNANWSRIRVKQTVKSFYRGGNAQSANGLGLQSLLGGPLESTTERHCSENVENKVLEAAGLKEGSTIPGVQITWYRHTKPCWDGQNPGTDGKYYTSKITAIGTEAVVDVPVEETDKMYTAWKTAVEAKATKTSLGAGLTTQIPD